MEQVIINVLSNAIKYTQEKGVINIELSDDDRVFLIEVHDNGIGIPEEDLKHIFNRFYRVDKARSRKRGGTGLGLAIAKEIMDMHNGEFIIESIFNEGTKAILKVPKRINL